MRNLTAKRSFEIHKKRRETEFIVINKRQEQKIDKAFKCIFFSKCDRRVIELKKRALHISDIGM